MVISFAFSFFISFDPKEKAATQAEAIGQG
jgi:hypothetical protein